MEPDRIFGDVADLYDKRRPGYPPIVFETVLDAAPGARQTIVEAGAGTGKATTGFAARGASIVAVEPDPRMAEICRRNTADTGRVRVVVAHFEAAELEPASFTMGVAAQSWHWVDPELGAAKMAAAIEPGGILALMWNTPAVDRSGIRLAIEAVYARHVPELAQGAFANGNVRRGELGDQPLIGPGRFGPPSWQQIPWSQRYTSLEYVELLETHSDHQALAPALRAGLLTDVRAVIDDHGGFLDYLYETDLAIFRHG